MKERLTPVTDPDEIEELTKDTADLAKPITFKPNGHLWAHAEQLEAWRQSRK